MNIKQLLEIAKIKPNPALDQFFLTDDKVLDEEVALASLKKGDTVLEVGPGIGNLTIRLSKKSHVLAVEKDYSFMNVLKGIQNCQAVFATLLSSWSRSEASSRNRFSTDSFQHTLFHIPAS